MHNGESSTPEPNKGATVSTLKRALHMNQQSPTKLSEERAAQAQAVILRMHEREQEIEALTKELARANQRIAELETKLEAKESTQADLESRMAGAFAQRDDAVLRLGRLQGFMQTTAASLVSFFREGGTDYVSEDILHLLDQLATSKHGERR